MKRIKKLSPAQVELRKAREEAEGLAKQRDMLLGVISVLLARSGTMRVRIAYRDIATARAVAWGIYDEPQMKASIVDGEVQARRRDDREARMAERHVEISFVGAG